MISFSNIQTAATVTSTVSTSYTTTSTVSTFLLQAIGSSTSADGQYAMVGAGSGFNDDTVTFGALSTATLFTLDSGCILYEESGNPGYVGNQDNGLGQEPLYFNNPSTVSNGEVFALAQCVVGEGSELDCTLGPYSVPSICSGTLEYYTGTNGCSDVTLLVVPS